MHSIHKKLSAFVKKYYLNELLKGGLLMIAILLSAALIALFSEGILWLNSTVRTVVVLVYSIGSLAVLAYFVARPLLQLVGLRKGLTQTKAAALIGHHFPEISDKLLNALQLELEAKSASSSELLLAGIAQKMEIMRPFDFKRAIDLSVNWKYAKYAIAPVLVMFLAYLYNPQLIADSGKRYANFNEEFEPPQPFYIELLNAPLAVKRGENFMLRFKAKGEIQPDKLTIKIGKNQFVLLHQDGLFSYEIKKALQTTRFTITHPLIKDFTAEVNVLPNPEITGLKVAISPPQYTGLTSTVVQNSNVVAVAEGADLTFTIQTNDASAIVALIDSAAVSCAKLEENLFNLNLTALKSASIELRALFDSASLAEGYSIILDVIKDEYPKIAVTETIDTTNSKVRYFEGQIKDDYGFWSCRFKGVILDENQKEVSQVNQEITINKRTSVGSIYHFLSIDDYQIPPGGQMSYYFEITDNDAINGGKTSKSEERVYKALTQEELANQLNLASNQAKSNMQERLDEAKELQKAIEEFERKLLEKPQLDWSDKKQLEELLKKQLQLQQQLQKDLGERKREMQQSNLDEQLLEKQRMLEELMEKVLTDEMKETLEKLEQLTEKLDKNQLKEELNKMKLNNEDIEKELDRNIELFKEMEFEIKLQQAINKAEDLKNKQEQLQNKTDDKSISEDQLAKEQDQLKEELEELAQKLEELEQSNESLENPKQTPDLSDDLKKAEEEMQQSKDKLDQQKRKESKQNQEKAKEKLEEMANSLSQFQQENEQEQLYEDMEDLRALLENLIKLSFDQEEIILKTRPLRSNDPQFVAMAVQQKNAVDNSKIIEDSLFALSKRIEQIAPDINREMNQVNEKMKLAQTALVERNSPKASEAQQYALTSVNNLALLLDEILQNMQQDMNSMMSSSGQCKKPGKQSGKSAGDLKKMQQQLNEQLKKLQQEMEGGIKPGDKPGQGKSGMSEQLAKMAAQQAAIREELKKLQDQLDGEGEGGAGAEMMKKIQDLMNKTEEDLVHKRITKETLSRQEEILTRLLESEKAEMERELDKKRESKEAEQLPADEKRVWENYIRQKELELELIKTVPSELSNYYRRKVEQYLNE